MSVKPLIAQMVECIHKVEKYMVALAGRFHCEEADYANIQAAKISNTPTPIIVSIAPTQSNVPAVSNECSPVFCASVFKVFLKCGLQERRIRKLRSEMLCRLLIRLHCRCRMLMLLESY